jgi:hypothetical protein
VENVRIENVGEETGMSMGRHVRHDIGMGVGKEMRIA